ncbi:hypothetical protein BaRGS_00037867 [Batillaria attramentaria]|uniref:Uncharacterized protein n=1 Tax=Batillaria attramentaria TaxID=370345 RepID=A0ABD0J7R1_9CAEN
MLRHSGRTDARVLQQTLPTRGLGTVPRPGLAVSKATSPQSIENIYSQPCKPCPYFDYRDRLPEEAITRARVNTGEPCTTFAGPLLKQANFYHATSIKLARRCQSNALEKRGVVSWRREGCPCLGRCTAAAPAFRVPRRTLCVAPALASSTSKRLKPLTPGGFFLPQNFGHISPFSSSQNLFPTISFLLLCSGFGLVSFLKPQRSVLQGLINSYAGDWSLKECQLAVLTLCQR